MKKDEAISILATSLRPREPKDRARYDEAVKMAIKALNCSEIPNNSDTISRQAAIEPEAISKWKKEFREYVDSLDIARDDWKGIIEYIDELPSAQPERKTGRWIYGESEVGNDGYYCSECGNFVPWIYEESAMNFIREYKFCPNCGAKMEGDEAE